MKPLLVGSRLGTGETNGKKHLIPTFQRSPLEKKRGGKKERKGNQTKT